MADKSVGELIAAQSVTPTDLFVLEQNGTAKKLTGQILENWLVSFADGHGGIQSWVPLKTEGLVKTFRVTLSDQTYIDIDVVDGRGVEDVQKIKTEGLVDTYQIIYNDGPPGTFTVTNGEKGDKGDRADIWVKYASQKPTASSHSFGDVPDAWIGIATGHNMDAAPTDWQQYTWFQWKGEKGDKGDPATLVSSNVEYQVSSSGTVIPSGSWSSSVPVVAQGKYLWTRTTNTFNTGSPVISYSVSRMGLDGSGSVSSVANISPDENGNVPLTAENIGALPNTGGDLTGELRMNGQPISGLNAPTANDHAANMGFVNQQMKKAAPRNLLDNSDFRNPVMQAGFDGLHGTVRYPIDRWYDQDGAGVYELTKNGIGISAGDNPAVFCQRISDAEKLIGKALTLAVCATSGEIFCGSGVYNNNTTCFLGNFGTPEKSFSIEGGYVRIYVAQAGLGLRWIALYEGEYTAETMPEYRPKGYAAELAECQRYYITINGAIAYGICTKNNTAEFVLPIPTTMRGNYPTYTFNNSLWAYRGDGSAVALTVTGAIATPGTVRFLCTTESSINVSMCVPDVKCEISTDL